VVVFIFAEDFFVDKQIILSHDSNFNPSPDSTLERYSMTTQGKGFDLTWMEMQLVAFDSVDHS